MLIKAKETDVPPVVKNVSSINFLDLSAADSKKFISLHGKESVCERFEVLIDIVNIDIFVCLH